VQEAEFFQKDDRIFSTTREAFFFRAQDSHLLEVLFRIDLFEEQTVHDQVYITANRTCKMGVMLETQAVMAHILRRIAGEFHISDKLHSEELPKRTLSSLIEQPLQLLGCYLFTSIAGCVTGGKIIETEAYRGAEDRASHAYNNRRTNRPEVMFHQGGVSYVSLCYGMHNMLNVVTNQEGVPHAILIRAIKPLEGIEMMLKRRKKKEN